MQSSTIQTNQGKRPARSRAEWIEEVKRWRESGQKGEEYCRAHDLHAGTLSYWASRLKADLAKASKSPKQARRFVPVRVSAARRPVARSNPQTAVGEFEVVLANGRQIRVAGAFVPETLARLIAVVEGAASC
jgi:hypothetical protein